MEDLHMRGKYRKPSELLKQQKETGKSYWDLIGRPLYEEPEGDYATQALRDALLLQIDNALNYPAYDRGKGPDDDLADFIIGYEGFLETPKDIGDGKITIGSGLTAKKYTSKGRITRLENRRAVFDEISERRARLSKTIPNWNNLPDSAKNALISYDYNYPVTAKSSPNFFRYMQSGDFQNAAKEMNAGWNMKGFSKGLRARRIAEQNMFLQDLVKPSNKIKLSVVLKPVEDEIMSEALQKASASYPIANTLIILDEPPTKPPVGRAQEADPTPYYLQDLQRHQYLQMLNSIKSKAPNPMELFQNIVGFERGKSYPFKFWNRNHNVLKPVISY